MTYACIICTVPPWRDRKASEKPDMIFVANRRRVLALAALLMCTSAAYGQEYFNFWFRNTLRLPVAPAWSIAADYQYRFQNLLPMEKPFQTPLLQSGRIWLHHKPSDHLQWDFSPLAYFHHWPLQHVSKPGDHGQSEYRSSLALLWRGRLAEHLQWLTRPGIEYRTFPQADLALVRLRHRWQLNCELSKWLYCSLSEEVFLHTRQPLWDHHRLQLLAGMEVSNQLTFEVGVMHARRQNRISRITTPENNLVFQLLWNLPGAYSTEP